MILLLGATGYVGQAFANEMRRRQLDFVSLSRRVIDYTRLETLFEYVRSSKPEFLINAAGYPGSPDVDACEVARAESLQANALLPQTIARVCYLTRTPWGHVSSGCIYSGAKVAQNDTFEIARDLNQPGVRRRFHSNPEAFRGFSESDAPNFCFRAPPCNFYSGTKALAEESLRWLDRIYVWRPRILFDEFDHPRNLLSKLQRYPRILDDLNSLSHRGEFVSACLDLWQQHADFGVYHIVNPGVTSNREIVSQMQEFGRRTAEIDFWSSPDEFHRTGKTHRVSCILDSSKLNTAGIRLRPVKEAIRDALEKWGPSPRDYNSLMNSPAVKQLQ